MSADSLDEVPDAASPHVYSEKSRRDARQAFREIGASAAAPGTPDRDECPICFEPEKSTALVPCGHILCGACAAKYAHCPVCREPVASRMRVFW